MLCARRFEKIVNACSSVSLPRQLGTLVVDCGTDDIQQAVYAGTKVSTSSNNVDVLVAGTQAEERSHYIRRLSGVGQVIAIRDACYDHGLAEPYSELIVQVQEERGYSHIVCSNNSFGKNIIPRAAAILGAEPVSDVIKIMGNGTYIRPIYAGNALATVHHAGKGVHILTIRSSAFQSPTPQENGTGCEASIVFMEDKKPEGQPVSEWKGFCHHPMHLICQTYHMRMS